MCLYCSWHRELRVGNSSKLLFQYESQMQVSRPRVLFVSRKQTADHGMSSKALVEKSASAVLYVQNLFQGYVGWMVQFLDIGGIWSEVHGSMYCLMIKSCNSSVCYWSAPWRALQLEVSVTRSGNKTHSHDCRDQGGFCPCIVCSAVLQGGSGSPHANHSFCFQVIRYTWCPVVLKLTPSDTRFPRGKPAWLVWEKNDDLCYVQVEEIFIVSGDHGSFPIQEKRWQQLCFFFFSKTFDTRLWENSASERLSGWTGSAAGSFFGRDASVHHLQEKMMRECCSFWSKSDFLAYRAQKNAQSREGTALSEFRDNWQHVYFIVSKWDCIK